ncbi:xanthine dehydrogenase accessory protein pucB [Virgibacillus halotolerans]|uniref:NTP transferase domain-containing protein n=1 Tax=Virgibacillus halotolerans TaxID=1071053 RepID=UPI00195FC490|nr:NTP transferase domain-containing protein [Virgibacillus halotolerans]MBM7598317.1 xanthine dehydrogenase accessory protein pucB [Virgibacillus halotolerans]
MRQKRIIGIYLAAGESKRFGGNKLFSSVGNHHLGSLALITALDSQLDKIVVVTTEKDQLNWVSPELFQNYQERWFHATSIKSTYGQSYSLKCGLQFADKLGADAVLIVLADQPFISSEMINKIIRQYQTSQYPYSFIAASYAGITRPPILISSEMFTDLYQLQGDKGARYLIQDRMNEGGIIEFTDNMCFFDVDTKEDYKYLLHKLKLK